MRRIIVTVDTEGHKGKDPIDKLIWGSTEQGRYGIEMIMDIFDEVGAKVLFFVDFAECADYGYDRIKEVCDCIITRGHDIGVHLHPDHMMDPERLFLFEYSSEDQERMITECTELYEKIVGRKPLSFRAGKYSADHRTLDILSELGYKYDFSEFYHQKWCGINPPITVNAPVKYRTLTEFPVTMFQGVHMGVFKREDKIDVEIMEPDEMRYALNQTLKAGFPMAVTLFMHSFTLMDWRGHPDTPVPNETNIERARAAARFIKESPDFEFIGEAELCDIETVSEEKALSSHIKWSNQLKGFCFTYRRAKEIKNFKAQALVWGTRAMVAAVAVLIIIFIINLL